MSNLIWLLVLWRQHSDSNSWALYHQKKTLSCVPTTGGLFAAIALDSWSSQSHAAAYDPISDHMRRSLSPFVGQWAIHQASSVLRPWSDDRVQRRTSYYAANEADATTHPTDYLRITLLLQLSHSLLLSLSRSGTRSGSDLPASRKNVFISAGHNEHN